MSTQFLSKAMFFPVVMYGCESWTIKKSESWRIDAFELWCWRREERKNPLVSQFSRSVMSDSLRPHESQHTRPPCPSPTPGVYSNSWPSSRWCHPAISSSVTPLSSCSQSLPASGSFPVSQPFTWGGQSTRVSASASVLPMKTQDWSPLVKNPWVGY